MNTLYYESSNTLMHHGIKGMKWGKRRFQNSDGSLTPAGRKGYITTAESQRNASRAANEARKKSVAESRASGDKGIGSFQRANRAALNAKRKAYGESIKADREHNKQLREERKAERNTPEAKAARRKKALKVGAAVAGTALAAYGVYKVNQYVKDNNARIKAAEEYVRSTNSFEATARANAKNFKIRQNSYNPMLSTRNEVNIGRNARNAGEYARETTNFRDAAKNVRNYKKSGGSLKDLRAVNSYKDERLIFEMDKDKKMFTRQTDDRKRFTRR